MAEGAGKYDLVPPREMSEREADIVQDCLREFSQMKLWRYTSASQWEETAELIWPTSRNTFQYGDFNWPGQKKTDRQVDATGMMALKRFGAILDSLLTPRNFRWHGLQANNDYVMKDRQTKLWFEAATRQLFKYRYAPEANFASQNQSSFISLGAFGNQGMFIDNFDGTQFGNIKGIRYGNMPLGELYFRENHQHVIDGFCRAFRLTAYQIYQKFKDKGRFPESLQTALEQSSQTPYYVLHCVCPQRSDDYDPDALDHRRFPWASYYIYAGQGIGGSSIGPGSALLLEEGGYYTFPAAISRYDQFPMEVYGRGPAQMVLPALKTLNAEKRTFLKQGHRAADPILLLADDGLLDFNLTPGAMNKGGMTSDGKPLVGILPTGKIEVTKEMMDEERKLINDAFLVSLFQILLETPQMTATEVIERTNEKGILLAPDIGRQQSEYLGPLIHRELDVLARQGLLPPMPPRLKEAKGEYQVEYTGPLSLMTRAQGAAGFLRTLETVKELVAVTQDATLLFPFNFEVAIPEIAEINAVPESWMSSQDQVDQKKKAHAQAMQRQQQIQEAPAKAAMMKAQAAQQKAGMGGPQTAPAYQPGPAPGGPAQ